MPEVAIRIPPTRLIRGWSVEVARPPCPKCPPADLKRVKIVVGMQHRPTTFHRTAITPKKSADA
jgi:hypothetical protein